MLTSGLTFASLDFSAAQIRSGYCLLGLAIDEDLKRVAHEISAELQLIEAPKLLRKFDEIVEGSPEEVTSFSAPQASSGSQPSAQGIGKRQIWINIRLI